MWDMDQAESAFFQVLVLNGLAPLATERTTQSLFYILQGRKANQTYQDVQIFHLYPYYRLFPSLSKETWQETLKDLREANWLVPEKMSGTTPKVTFRITEAGQAVLDKGRHAYELEKWFQPLQGAMQAGQLQEMELRLHLLIQTVSQLLVGKLNFFPLVRQKQVQSWVKQQLHDVASRKRWMCGLYDELYTLLSTTFDEDLQRLLVRQWSGANQTGMTLHQLALAEQTAPSWIRLKTMYVLAVISQKVRSDPTETQYPLLSRLVNRERDSAEPVEKHLLSETAKVTYTLLTKGLSLDEVAATRQLKANTIEDHLVELALRMPDWDMSAYVALQEKKEIISASRELKTRRLRIIKDHFGNRFSYLQIRLALTGMQEGEEHESYRAAPD